MALPLTAHQKRMKEIEANMLRDMAAQRERLASLASVAATATTTKTTKTTTPKPSPSRRRMSTTTSIPSPRRASPRFSSASAVSTPTTTTPTRSRMKRVLEDEPTDADVVDSIIANEDCDAAIATTPTNNNSTNNDNSSEDDDCDDNCSTAATATPGRATTRLFTVTAGSSTTGTATSAAPTIRRRSSSVSSKKLKVNDHPLPPTSSNVAHPMDVDTEPMVPSVTATESMGQAASAASLWLSKFPPNPSSATGGTLHANEPVTRRSRPPSILPLPPTALSHSVSSAATATTSTTMAATRMSDLPRPSRRDTFQPNDDSSRMRATAASAAAAVVDHSTGSSRSAHWSTRDEYRCDFDSQGLPAQVSFDSVVDLDTDDDDDANGTNVKERVVDNKNASGDNVVRIVPATRTTGLAKQEAATLDHDRTNVTTAKFYHCFMVRFGHVVRLVVLYLGLLLILYASSQSSFVASVNDRFLHHQITNGTGSSSRRLVGWIHDNYFMGGYSIKESSKSGDALAVASVTKSDESSSQDDILTNALPSMTSEEVLESDNINHVQLTSEETVTLNGMVRLLEDWTRQALCSRLGNPFALSPKDSLGKGDDDVGVSPLALFRFTDIVASIGLNPTNGGDHQRLWHALQSNADIWVRTGGGTDTDNVIGLVSSSSSSMQCSSDFVK